MQYKRTLMSCLIVILILCTSVFTIGATSETAPFELAVEVTSSTAVSEEPFVLEAGDTFEVSISIDSNPGICALDLRLSYDSEALTLLKKGTAIDYVKGDAVPADLMVSEVNENTVKVFLNIQEKDFTTNGSIVTFKFQVKEGFHGSAEISVPKAFFMQTEGYKTPVPEFDCDRVVNVHNFVAAPESVAADCLNAEVLTYTCDTCSEKVVTTGADALGHNFSTEWTVDTAPTCLVEGSKSHHCTRCDEIADVTVVEKAAHTFGEWTQVTAPACTEKGSEKRTCTVCNDAEETQEIAALGHDYATEWTVDTEATCTTAGSKSKHCSRCTDKTEVTDIPAKGHNFGDWVVDKAPNCTDKGSNKRTCPVCNTTETMEVAALGHISANYEDVEATTKEVGYTGGTYCTVCNVTLTERTEIPKLNYTWLYILIAVVVVAVVVVIGGGVVAYFLISKKKKNAAN